MTTKIDKIKALGTNPEATNGERQAAAEALRRKGAPLDIEPAADEITLIPLAMVAPSNGIYAPSKMDNPVTVPRSQLPNPYTFWVSLSPDKISNPQKRKVYKFNANYWMMQ